METITLKVSNLSSSSSELNQSNLKLNELKFEPHKGPPPQGLAHNETQLALHAHVHYSANAHDDRLLVALQSRGRFRTRRTPQSIA